MQQGVDWGELVDRSPEGRRAFLGRVAQSGVIYGGEPLCRVQHPLLLSTSTALAYARLLGGFHQAIRHVRAMIVDDGLDGRPGSLALRIGLSPGAVRLAALHPGYPSAAVLARLDTFLVDGHPWFLELNGESPAGMAYSDRLTELFLAQPSTALAGATPMRPGVAAARAILATYREAGGQEAQPHVAIVDHLDVPTRPEFDLFKSTFEAMGCPCSIAGPADLDWYGHHLRAHGKPVDVVYRRALVMDILANPTAWAPLIDAYAAQRVVLVNNLRTSLLHTKGLFALLHDPMVLEVLPPAIGRLIQGHIPWTGILSEEPGIGAPPDLRERVRAARSEWVLKPMTGHGGKGVCVGEHMTQGAWEAAVDGADHHVAQLRVPQPLGRFPDASIDGDPVSRCISLDPFLVRGRLVGFLCRLSPSELGNVASGASQVPVFVR